MAIDVNIPSQVKNYANLAAFPATGSLKTIFIAEDTNKTYRWTGSAYVEISASQATAWGAITGTLSNQTDLQTALNAKQDSLGFTAVPTTRTLTINGTTQDLSADRTFTVSTGITIGTTAITSGTVGRVLFEGTGNVVQESANLFWDNTNGRLGIGGTPSTFNLDVVGTARVQSKLTVGTSTVSPYNFNVWGGAFESYISLNNTNSGTGSADGFQIGLEPNGVDVFFLNRENGFIQFRTADTNRMRIANTGNVLINTTTDAGFKLDVNGTARVQSNLYFGTAGSYLLGDTNNIRIYDKNNTIILQAFPNGVTNSETYLRSASGNFSFLRLRDDYVSLEYAVAGVSATAQNPIQINRGYFGNVLATDKSVLYVKSTLNSNLSNATTLRGIYIDINDTTTYTGFTNTRAIEAPRGGAYFNTTSVNASAILQADSTIKGFLPPRMTTTQINAIATPAEGLTVYNTTISHMCFYQAGSWVRINHSPM